MRRCNSCHRYYDGTHWYCPECQAKSEARRTEERERKIREGYNMALIDARETKGMTQTMIAKKLGLATATYGHMERNIKRVKPSQRRIIAAALGKSVEELWDTPYYAQCTTCKQLFATDRDVHVCPACLERVRETAQARSRSQGNNESAINIIAREARKAGMTYGQYVARQEEIRRSQNDQNNATADR